MSWETHYLPPDPLIWQGRSDIPDNACFYQRVQLIDLLNAALPRATHLSFALLGFKCDEGVQRDLGRAGAFEGPVAIRQRLAALPVQKPEITIIDVGNVVCTKHDLEASQQALADVVHILINAGYCPIVLGGGGETSWGHYQGFETNFHAESKLGILNFSPQFDLFAVQSNLKGGSAATVFRQIAESHRFNGRQFDYNCLGIQYTANIRQQFDLAKQLDVHFILADEVHLGLIEKCFDFLDRIIDKNEIIYVSLGLDIFSAAFAPGVNSPQTLGLLPWQVIPLLRQVAASNKVASYEITGCIPHYDIDHRTAKLAASLIYEIIHHHHDFHKP